ncbi:hypothetical protein TrVFT333_009943 [Trichoderma virens FT-333]|nr:hypothetical protein TrVFT333_009943 [Trichoderma virens FT-333]
MLPSKTTSWKQFDFVGTILGIAASVLVVFAFQNAGESEPGTWGRPVFIAPLIIALPESALHKKHFDDFPSGLSTSTPDILVSNQDANRTVAIGSMVSGKVNAVKDHISGTLRCGSWLMGLGFVLLTTIRGSEDDAKAFGFLAFVGFGFGLFTAAATNVISVDVLTRQKVINRLPEIIPPEELDFMEGDMKNLTGPSLEAVQKAYVSAFHKSITTAAVAACLAVLSTAFMSCHIRPKDVEQQHEGEAALPDDGQRRVVELLIPLQDIPHAEELSK